MHAQVQQNRTIAAASDAGLETGKLWAYYYGIGGFRSQGEIAAYLEGQPVLPQVERDILAHAVNEILDETPSKLRAPFSYEGETALQPDGSSRAEKYPEAPALASLGAAAAVFLTAAEAENERLTALRRTRLLDTPPEERFDQITSKAQSQFGVRSAIVALIAEDRQFLKSAVGPIGQNMPRETAFCNETIRNPYPMIVPDALADERFSSNPLVVGEPHIRFYAGAPLQGPGGWNVGTLCIIDPKPREFSDEHRQVLRGLAGRAQEEINA